MYPFQEFSICTPSWFEIINQKEIRKYSHNIFLWARAGGLRVKCIRASLHSRLISALNPLYRMHVAWCVVHSYSHNARNTYSLICNKQATNDQQQWQKAEPRPEQKVVNKCKAASAARCSSRCSYSYSHSQRARTREDQFKGQSWKK